MRPDRTGVGARGRGQTGAGIALSCRQSKALEPPALRTNRPRRSSIGIASIAGSMSPFAGFRMAAAGCAGSARHMRQIPGLRSGSLHKDRALGGIAAHDLSSGLGPRFPRRPKVRRHGAIIVMNLNQLRFASALARHASFTRAAEECAVTQPTLSNAIAYLEEEFGEKIFLRTTRKVSLTPFGANLLPEIERVLSAQQNLLQRGSSAAASADPVDPDRNVAAPQHPFPRPPDRAASARARRTSTSSSMR